LAISLCANVALGVAVSRMLPAVATAQNQTSKQAPNGPAVGTPVSDVKLQAMDGSASQLTLTAADRPTVVYVFSPSCHWCERNLANFRAWSPVSTRG
jgi:hypothetical protein